MATTHLAQAEDEVTKRWVQGSWVNVRINSAADSTVITQITVSTPVSLRAQFGKSCEITWGKDQQGFVPCKLLGERPLTLAEVANQSLADGTPNSQYSPSRAFWIAPSAEALFSAGKHFQSALLNPKQLSLEEGYGENGDFTSFGQPAPHLVRYPVPEFEAMKALLANGLVAATDLAPPLLTCQQMLQAKDQQLGASQKNITQSWPEWRYPKWENFPHAYMFVSDCRVPELPNLSLPTIRPSLFKSSKELAPGNAQVERLSAHFGIVERGRVIGSPKWEMDYDMERYTGAWDIGRYEIALKKPVIEHVIGRSGLLSAYQWTPQQRDTPFGPSARCDEGLHNRRKGKELLSGYPKVKDALLWFQSPVALPYQRAKITSRTERVPQSTKITEEGGISSVVIYEVDLNEDGIADFVQWDIWGRPQITGPDPLLTLREVFVNIAGEWYPLEQDSYAECT